MGHLIRSHCAHKMKGQIVTAFLVAGVFSFLLVFSIYSSVENSGEKFSFKNSLGSLTGFIVWPGQPSKPSAPGGDINSCVDSSWTCGDYGLCVAKSQSKTCKSNCNNTKVETQSCVVPVGVVSCQEKDWKSTDGECKSNNKSVRSWTPVGTCTGGITKPATEEISCVYQLPACKDADWKSADGACKSNNKLNRTWERIGDCAGGATKVSSELISCNYQAPVCTRFDYNDWTNCSQSGVQTREVVSSYPAGCQGGNKNVSTSCVYVAPVNNQPIVNENSAPSVTNLSFKKIAQDSKNSYYSLSKNQTSVVNFVSSDSNFVLNSSNYNVSEGKTGENNYFIFKSTSDKNYTKEVYFNLKVSSRGICIKDEEIDSVSQILQGCMFIACPGANGNYKCTMNSSDAISKTVIVSGLKHSGIVEVGNGSFCGDLNCSSDESCSSCSMDCGVCQSSAANNLGGSSGGGGGGGGSGSSQNNSGGVNNVANSSDFGSQNVNNDGSSSDEVYNSENSSGNTAGSFGWIYLIMIAIGLIVVIMIIVLVRRKRSVVVQTRYGLGKSEDDRIIEEIKDKISLGNNFIESGNSAGALDTYKTIFGLYKNLSSTNSEVYAQIMEFYNNLTKR